jgi:cell surface protein SprA
MDRQMGETKLRPISQDEIIIPTYNKFWTWDRLEGFKFDISKGLNLDFNAIANTRIDEPQGLLDTDEKKDSVWNNIKNFGRTTNYTHSTNINYTVPLNKIPILDLDTSHSKVWIKLRMAYRSFGSRYCNKPDHSQPAWEYYFEYTEHCIERRSEFSEPL